MDKGERFWLLDSAQRQCGVVEFTGERNFDADLYTVTAASDCYNFEAPQENLHHNLYVWLERGDTLAVPRRSLRPLPPPVVYHVMLHDPNSFVVTTHKGQFLGIAYWTEGYWHAATPGGKRPEAGGWALKERTGEWLLRRFEAGRKGEASV